MTLTGLHLVSTGAGHAAGVGQLLAARMSISDVEVKWTSAVNQRLEELVRLKEGWDGYKAFPVSFGTAVFAYRMLEAICRPDTPAPHIVPGASGDLQIEWHTHQGDIELWVKAPNKVQAWYAKDDDDEGVEIELRNDFEVVSEWVRKVTEPEIAYAAAA